MKNSEETNVSSPNTTTMTSIATDIEAAANAALAIRLERERKGKEKKLRKTIAKGQLSDITLNRLVSELQTNSTDIYNIIQNINPSSTNTSGKKTDLIPTSPTSSTTLSSSASSSSLIELTFRDTIHRSTSDSTNMELPNNSSSSPSPQLLLHPEHIQHLLLWLLSGQMDKPNWITVKNKGLINNIVLLFIRDLGYKELITTLSASTSDTTSTTTSISSIHLPFLSSLPLRKIKYPRTIWNPWYRVISMMDHKILYLPKNAIVVDNNAKLRLSDDEDSEDVDDNNDSDNDLNEIIGDKRKRSANVHNNSSSKKRKHQSDIDLDDDDDDDDENDSNNSNDIFDEHHLASQRRKRLFELSLSIHELIEHKFSLALPRQSLPETNTNTIRTNNINITPFSDFHKTLPPGRIAGVPADICKLCPLHIPSGYILTRTAHFDIHNAYADNSIKQCPVFQYYQYIDQTNPISAINTTTTISTTTLPNQTTSTTVTQQTKMNIISNENIQPVPIFGLDCEMCQTKDGRFQLARATVVDSPLTSVLNDTSSDPSSYMDVRFDELVKPEEPVHDYKTKFSGITKELLDTAKYDITYVQDALADIFDGIVSPNKAGKGTIKSIKRIDNISSSSTSSSSGAPLVSLRPAFIVGHSIENDIASIRIIHTRLIDTSLIFPHPSGLPRRYSLRQLALTHLGRIIQDQESGHDSTEDAMTTLHLAHSLIEEDIYNPDDEEDEENENETIPSSLDINDILFDFFFHRPIRPGWELPDINKNNNSEYFNKGLANTLRLLNTATNTNTITNDSNNDNDEASLTTDNTLNNKYRPIINHRYAIKDELSKASNRHILGLPDMNNKEKVANVVVIGSPSFVATNVAGSASGINCGHNHVSNVATSSSTNNNIAKISTVGEARRLTDTIINQTEKIATARKEGRYPFTAASLVVAELFCPTDPVTETKNIPNNSNNKKNSKVINAPIPSMTRLEALDQVLGGLCSKLPVGTAVIMVSQASRLRYGVQTPPGSAMPTSSLGEDNNENMDNNPKKSKKGNKTSDLLGAGRMKKSEAAASIDGQYGAVFLHVINPSTKKEAHHWKNEE